MSKRAKVDSNDNDDDESSTLSVFEKSLLHRHAIKPSAKEFMVAYREELTKQWIKKALKSSGKKKADQLTSSDLARVMEEIPMLNDFARVTIAGIAMDQ